MNFVMRPRGDALVSAILHENAAGQDFLLAGGYALSGPTAIISSGFGALDGPAGERGG